MEIVGKSLRSRLLRALVVLLALLGYGYLTNDVNWVTTLLVPPLFFLFSVGSDYAVQRWAE